MVMKWLQAVSKAISRFSVFQFRFLDFLKMRFLLTLFASITLIEKSCALTRVVKNVYYNENCEGTAGSVVEYKNVKVGECMTNSRHSFTSGDAIRFSCSSIWEVEAKMYFRTNASNSDVAKACSGDPGLVQSFYDSVCYKSQM